MNKKQIAIVGAGMWGKTHIETIQQEGRGEVRWVCDALPAARAAVQEKFGVPHVTQQIEDVLADPAVDCVIVASPPFTHAEYALAVLQAGKNLVVEKPMALNAEQARQIAAEAARHPELVILEGSARHARLNPKFRFVKELIESGKLGRVYHISHQALGQGTFIEYNPNGAWAMNKQLAGGGPFIDWGVYDLSFHLGVLGDAPQLKDMKAFAIGGLRDLSDRAPVVDVEMHGAALMEFTGGLTYAYSRGAGVHGASQNETRIFGTQGGLQFAYTSWEAPKVEYFYGDREARHETLAVDMSGHPRHDNLAFIGHLMDCLEGVAKPVMTPALAAKHLEILYQIIG